MWQTFLLGMTAPIVMRVLSTLGFGVVTYTGLSAVLQVAYQHIQTSFSSLPADLMALIFLSGLPQGMSIMISAMAARIGMMQLQRIQKII